MECSARAGYRCRVAVVRGANDPKPDEDIASKIVALRTGISLEPLDNRLGIQLADFKFIDGAGEQVGLLEVSSYMPQNRPALIRALSKHKMRVHSSRYAWYVYLSHDEINVKQLSRLLPAALARIESAAPRGVQAVVNDPVNHPYFDNGLSAEDNSFLHALGVESVATLPPRTSAAEGYLMIVPRAVGGMIGPSLVTEEVNRVLAMGDNRAKLGAAAPLQRAEMFVWLTDSLGSLALESPYIDVEAFQQFPTDAPTLPPEVTAVWVATGARDAFPYARALWHSDGGVWQVLEL
jgi:hypothetical protein